MHQNLDYDKCYKTIHFVLSIIHILWVLQTKNFVLTWFLWDIDNEFLDSPHRFSSFIFSPLRHFAAYTHSFDIFQFKSNKCVHCARMLWVSHCPPNICFLLKVIYLYDVRVSALVIDAKRINYSITKRRYRAYCPFQFF